MFTADPQFTVLHGGDEIGAVDPLVFTCKVDGPPIISLGGRAWKVTFTDWNDVGPSSSRPTSQGPPGGQERRSRCRTP